MTIAYIGSKALNFYIDPGHQTDIDFIAPYDEIVKFAKDKGIKTFYPIDKGTKIFMRLDKQIYEAEVAYPGSCAEEILEAIENDPYSTMNCDGSLTASLNCLYMLKMSHRFKKNSPHFKKTMSDIIQIRNYQSATTQKICIDTVNHPWWNRRVKETYDYDHPKLNQNKQDFFDTPGVTYKYDHDGIHKAIAINPGIPAYTKFMKDDAEVQTDSQKFDMLPMRQKLDAVVEESCVLAIERSLVPFPGVLTQTEAFLMALEKVCTSITSGWFREFAWNHYYEAILHYTDHFYDYFEKFESRKHLIQLHKGNTI